MKKVIKIVPLIVICAFLIIYVISDINKKRPLLTGYYDKAEYYQKDGFQDYTDYCKYYYTEEYDESFANSELYEVVTDKSIGGIRVFFDNFEKWMETLGRSAEYDLDKYSINVGDYVYIDPERNTLKNYTIYLYDTDTHTLYYIHSNI